MRIDRVTGDGWWRMFRSRALPQARAREAGNGEFLSQPVTCHPNDAGLIFAAGVLRTGDVANENDTGVQNLSRSTL
jgi:hypothetical protein